MQKILLIVIVASLFLGCRYKSGSGEFVRERREAGPFSAIRVSSGFEVELKNGPTSVVVEADDNLIKYIQTDVSNGRLNIKLRNIRLRDGHLKVFVTAPSINSIEASSAAEVVAKDLLKSEQLELHSSSGGKIEASIDAPRTTLHASSGGSLTVSGSTRDLKAESSSGSSIKAGMLLSEHTTVTVSSGASARVHASVTLNARASSGGNVSYRGGATVTQNASSAGSIAKE